MELSRVITVSDRSAAGLRPDLSGPALAELIRAAGYDVEIRLVADGSESVREALRAALDEGARLIVTTGGTGVGPRDRTPEATAAVIDRELPGLAEAIRAEGRRHSSHAALSRGVAGVVDPSPGSPGALIVNLPGSPAAVRDGAEVLLPVARHALAQLSGADH